MNEKRAKCPHCGHEDHGVGGECEHPVSHGPSHWHRCLCLNLVGADLACPPLMVCQGGALGYADIWNLQQGHSVRRADGTTVTPDVLTAGRSSAGHPADEAADDDPDQLRSDLAWARQMLLEAQAEATALATGAEKAEAVIEELRLALEEARFWACHGYELGQRHCTWSDHGVAPDWLRGSHRS